VAAATLFGAMFPILSCGTTTVCRESGGGGVSRWCVEQRLARGNEIWIHTRRGEALHGTFIGAGDLDGAPAILMYPYREWGPEKTDTTRIEMSEIRSVNRLQETPGFLAGLLIGVSACVVVFFLLIPGDFGLR
jgi:hypothetical protein